jgi:hypothetical protein
MLSDTKADGSETAFIEPLLLGSPAGRQPVDIAVRIITADARQQAIRNKRLSFILACAPSLSCLPYFGISHS